MTEIGLGHYLTLGAIIFSIGIIGIFLNRKNIIVIIMVNLKKLPGKKFTRLLSLNLKIYPKKRCVVLLEILPIWKLDIFLKNFLIEL